MLCDYFATTKMRATRICGAYRVRWENCENCNLFLNKFYFMKNTPLRGMPLKGGRQTASSQKNAIFTTITSDKSHVTGQTRKNDDPVPPFVMHTTLFTIFT